MNIRFENRSEFSVYGYAVETILNSNGNDTGRLWENYKDALLRVPESKSCLYGVLWYTEEHRYFYLLGIQSEKPPMGGMTAVVIPAALFAVAAVPSHMNATEAWTQYFETELPALHYVPEAKHGKYFEFYNADGECELWTPVTKQLEQDEL